MYILLVSATILFVSKVNKISEELRTKLLIYANIRRRKKKYIYIAEEQVKMRVVGREVGHTDKVI